MGGIEVKKGDSAMTIRFDDARWAQVKNNYRSWWAGELDRPLISITVNGYESNRPKAKQPCHGFQSFHGAGVAADEIVDCWDYDLSTKKFLGDAFPCVWPNFGPGVLAAFTGCELRNAERTVWFHHPEEKELRDVHVKFNGESHWYRRIREIMVAAQKRWQGEVQVGMTDLGGSLDVMASFRGSEPLLMDLYDHPEEIKRVSDEIHRCWWQYFDLFTAALRPPNPGYTAWTPIFSEESYYMLQCDFCYMIGPDMFDEFVKPELAASCRKLKHAFYHLDGIGELPHLDSLLSIPELAGVQWVPGAGQKDASEWTDVYKRIRAAGKLVQLFGYGDPRCIDAIAEKMGSLKGFIIIDSVPKEREQSAVEVLKRHGVP
ncbi:MAG: hypothetical protein C0404_01850 [Verrucomicrobia bacterium]|nr:hypothetical protein [Verrucomicrobiota bacterium]